MRILVLGGSRFLGRAFAAEALAAGHDVTVFNRGLSGPDLPGVQAIRGDREDPADLGRLVAEGTAAGPWDAVVDTSGYVPKVVGDGARALAGAAGAYLFVSSVSAFAHFPARSITDGSPLLACEPDATEGEYGPLKAGCERALRAAFPGRVLIHSPGIILGPHENAGRLTWWLSRIARGGDVLAPGEPEREMQLIDARDIARFGLRCLQEGRTEPYLLTGPKGHTTFGGWLAACVEATGAHARLVWAPDELLLERGVPVWSGLPLWSPRREPFAGVWDTDVSNALKAGLECRPIAETVRDTWAWLRDAPSLADDDGRINGHGLPPADEQRILEALRDGGH
ncbi:NAD-dependent epimerase/dehydratase family protein [Actinocrinis puniceicyclus]|uniref:NAD-dependent epimerase/dehydratase family protein n=1 Tax=Actinocrinis puniceicyclus TaxID=977794 RepID=A0A8J7WGF3_9ACTN|nr:NAD-dependent epimerase/dehydratase family protein [Actinocrinis puniceicyclus]MBS2961661.1 NAD-dependent epimerase/dehydratase family protein [Actinocrinis puniceicyclus]